MTLSQLRTFALVARLGSLHAAATALEVSEPAVSAALAALRQDLGDPLFVRSPGGITLTPGGRALADYAQDIVGLADQARWEVANAKNDAGQLKIAATAPFAEHAAGRLLDLFTKRVPGASVDVVAVAAEDLVGLLLERAYDIALGARPLAPAGTPATEQGLESVPFLRYQRVFVADAGDPLGRMRGPWPWNGCWEGRGSPGPRASWTTRRKDAGSRASASCRKSSGSAARRMPWRPCGRGGDHAGDRTHRPGRGPQRCADPGSRGRNPGAGAVVGQHPGPAPDHHHGENPAAFCPHGRCDGVNGRPGRFARAGAPRLEIPCRPVELTAGEPATWR